MIHQPLNFLDYKKQEAVDLLTDEIGWQNYGDKHHESNFTKFIESYWLPAKFGFDKRKAHLSSLIHSEQITRKEALKALEKKGYNEEDVVKDMTYIASKLGMSFDELKDIFNGKNKQFYNYKSNNFLIGVAIKIQVILGNEKRLFI